MRAGASLHNASLHNASPDNASLDNLDIVHGRHRRGLAGAGRDMR